MTDKPPTPLTVKDIEKRYNEGGFPAATATVRQWVAMETINAADLATELRFWLSYLGGE